VKNKTKDKPQSGLELTVLHCLNNSVGVLQSEWRAKKLPFLREYTKALFEDVVPAIQEDALSIAEFQGILLGVCLLLEQEKQSQKTPADETARLITGLRFTHENS
jgi:hypothetical protein